MAPINLLYQLFIQYVDFNDIQRYHCAEHQPQIFVTILLLVKKYDAWCFGCYEVLKILFSGDCRSFRKLIVSYELN